MIDWYSLTVEELARELTKRGLPGTITCKIDLLAKLKKFCENERFEYFPKLPTELRQAIFEMALPGDRLAAVGFTEEDAFVALPKPVEIYGFMSVCQDAYSAAVRWYGPVAMRPGSVIRFSNIKLAHSSVGQVTWDNVFFVSCGFLPTAEYWIKDDGHDMNMRLIEFMKYAKAIAVPMEVLLRWTRKIAKTLLRYRSLEKIIVLAESPDKVYDLGQPSQVTTHGIDWSLPSYLGGYSTKSDNALANEIASNFYQRLEVEKEQTLALENGVWVSRDRTLFKKGEVDWKPLPAYYESLKKLKFLFSKGCALRR